MVKKTIIFLIAATCAQACEMDEHNEKQTTRHFTQEELKSSLAGVYYASSPCGSNRLEYYEKPQPKTNEEENCHDFPYHI